MTTPPARRSWIVRLLRGLGALLLLLALALVLRAAYAFRDRSPGYAVRIAVDGAAARAEPRPLRAGFAREKINPDLADPRARSTSPGSARTAARPRSTTTFRPSPGWSTTATPASAA